MNHNLRYIGTGFLAFHPKYWSLKQGAYLKAPDSLKEFYKTLISTIKKKSKSIKGQKTTYWISEQAKRELDSGELHCSIEF